MRAILLRMLVGTAVVACQLSVVASASAGQIGTGTYKARVTHPHPGQGAKEYKFKIIVNQCSSRLCVAVPSMPYLSCTGQGVSQFSAEGRFRPARLSKAGKITEHVPTTGIGQADEAIFSVAFTTKGTASGYVELTSTITEIGGKIVKCTSGKVPFTAKRG